MTLGHGLQATCVPPSNASAAEAKCARLAETQHRWTSIVLRNSADQSVIVNAVPAAYPIANNASMCAGPSQEGLAAMLPSSLDLDLSAVPSWNGPVAQAPAGDRRAPVGSGRKSKPPIGDSFAAHEVC